MILFDPMYFVFIAPAMLLAFWAQMRISSTYAKAQKQPAPLSGAAAARHILDSAGLHHVDVEQVGGHLSDHYDPRAKVLRLSTDVYRSNSLAAVGIAAHEAGHAIQDGRNYIPLVIRNFAVPAAQFGSSFGIVMLMAGAMMSLRPLILAGIAVFSCVVFFQVINLPVEFDASARAKRQLADLGIVDAQRMVYVNKVLNAAAMTYVAATLQAILTLLFYVYRFAGNSRD